MGGGGWTTNSTSTTTNRTYMCIQYTVYSIQPVYSQYTVYSIHGAMVYSTCVHGYMCTRWYTVYTVYQLVWYIVYGMVYIYSVPILILVCGNENEAAASVVLVGR